MLMIGGSPDALLLRLPKPRKNLRRAVGEAVAATLKDDCFSPRKSPGVKRGGRDAAGAA